MSTFEIIHSLLRWAVILTAFWALWRSFRGVLGKTPYTQSDNRSGLFFMISCDIQVLIGFVLYFGNGWAAKWTEGNMKQVMSDKFQRFFTVEHASMMLIAWIIVHVGRTLAKKAKTDQEKHKKSLIYFGVAILLILLAIPWPFRTGLGYHPWFIH
ncbi:MAG: hypothetical protein ACYCOO_05910 [Chitinophagaceae bacterium]